MDGLRSECEARNQHLRRVIKVQQFEQPFTLPLLMYNVLELLKVYSLLLASDLRLSSINL